MEADLDGESGGRISEAEDAGAAASAALGDSCCDFLGEFSASSRNFRTDLVFLF